MFARLWAIGCLLFLNVSVGRPATEVAPRTWVSVYLKSHQDSVSPAIGYMQTELTSSLASAGVGVHWVDAGQALSAPGRLLTIELRGVCQPVWSSVGIFTDLSALAASEIVDGKVLPYGWIDCTALNQLLGRSLPRDSEDERAKVYGRALSRLLAHEVYHMLAQTEKHTRTGLSKARFNVADLLAQNLRFEPSAVAKLRLSMPDDVRLANKDAASKRTP